MASEIVKDTDRLVSYPQFCAEFVNVSRVTLQRWRDEENFPAPVVIAGRNYFKVSEIRTWFAGRSEAATPAAA